MRKEQGEAARACAQVEEAFAAPGSDGAERREQIAVGILRRDHLVIVISTVGVDVVEVIHRQSLNHKAH